MTLVDYSIIAVFGACYPQEPEDKPLFTRRLTSPLTVSPPRGNIDPWWRRRLTKPSAITTKYLPGDLKRENQIQLILNPKSGLPLFLPSQKPRCYSLLLHRMPEPDSA